jgi:6-phospho-beta-glucosidase
MKLTFIGAGGARTPLVIQSILDFQQRLPLRQVCLMDTDAERLELMRLASRPRPEGRASFAIEWTTDPRRAIAGADYVVTTFRAGLMQSRVIDEQVPLRHGVIGQETTGPGGFAMALRTIPAMLGYVELIRQEAPRAWLLNFTNPAGMVTEAVTRVAGFERAIGICDNPSAMLREAAGLLGVLPEQLYPEYYGLNHLGWLRGAYLDGENQVPAIIQHLTSRSERLPGLPFDPGLIEALGAIPNEYLYFYYYPRQSVDNLLRAGQSRAQQILPFNDELYAALRRIRDEAAPPAHAEAAYAGYLARRRGTYMTLETGKRQRTVEPAGDADSGAGHGQQIGESAEGYTGVTLRLIEALAGGQAGTPILNVPNRGALPGMADDDVVEVTCLARQGLVRPMAMGPLPDHALGLMKMVKAYERLTIQAAVEGSYALALQALTLHPLVPSHEIARKILDDYVAEHWKYFPQLG